MPALGTFNSVTLAIGTPVQVTPPGTGHYAMQILNSAGGKLYISKQNTVGANATSFLVPTGSYSPNMLVTGTASGLWIASDTAGTVSIYCAAR
jgi:hypothetical protein